MFIYRTWILDLCQSPYTKTISKWIKDSNLLDACTLCKHCRSGGKVSWLSGTKEYYKVTESIASYSSAPGKGPPSASATTVPRQGRVSPVKLLQLGSVPVRISHHTTNHTKRFMRKEESGMVAASRMRSSRKSSRVQSLYRAWGVVAFLGDLQLVGFYDLILGQAHWLVVFQAQGPTVRFCSLPDSGKLRSWWYFKLWFSDELRARVFFLGPGLGSSQRQCVFSLALFTIHNIIL